VWAVPLLLVAILAALTWWRSVPVPEAGGSLAPPTRAVVEANTLRVFSADGRELWSHPFEHPVQEAYYANPSWFMQPLRFEDLDGDGTRELLALALFSEPGRGFDLYCFEADGRRRFTWSPSRTITYGDNTWNPPYHVHTSVLVRGEGPPALWVAAPHHLYYPSVVARLDAAGRVQAEFWTNGHAITLASATLLGRRVVVIGSANNEFRRAGLTVIDAVNGSGSTPAVNPAYRCADCPPGSPLAAIVFPVPDLPAATSTGGIPAVMSLVPNDGGLAVGVGFPSGQDAPGTPLLGAWYEFDTQLRPQRAELSAQYEAAHRRAEEAGAVDHAYNAAIEARQLFPILSWDGSKYVPVSPKPKEP
jgi:hypothetical protein